MWPLLGGGFVGPPEEHRDVTDRPHAGQGCVSPLEAENGGSWEMVAGRDEAYLPLLFPNHLCMGREELPSSHPVDPHPPEGPRSV